MNALPDGWSWTTLGAISAKPQYGWTTKADADGPGLRLLRTTDITPGCIEWSRVPYCTDEPDDPARFLLETDDIVVSRAGSVGASIRVVGPPPAVFASYLIRLRAARDVDPAYVGHYLRSPRYWQQIGEAAAGIALLNVNAKKLAAIQIPLPPAPEQLRIVAAIEEQFSRLDAAEQLLRQARARTPFLRGAVYSVAMSGEWPSESLGELLREPLRNGHSAKASRTGEVRTLTLTAVTRGEFTDENTKLTSADPARIANLWLEPGDVLIERSNTPELVGTAALYRGRDRWAIFPDLLIRVRVTDKLLPEFLAVVFKSRPVRRYFQASAQGIAGSMPKIDQGTVERLGVPLPPLDEQRRIVSEVEQQLSLIAAMHRAIEAASRRSTALRRSILERAFRGELVPQDPSDEAASVLLERIAAERATAEEATGRRPRRRATMQGS